MFFGLYFYGVIVFHGFLKGINGLWMSESVSFFEIIVANLESWTYVLQYVSRGREQVRILFDHIKNIYIFRHITFRFYWIARRTALMQVDKACYGWVFWNPQLKYQISSCRVSMRIMSHCIPEIMLSFNHSMYLACDHCNKQY